MFGCLIELSLRKSGNGSIFNYNMFQVKPCHEIFLIKNKGV